MKIVIVLFIYLFSTGLYGSDCLDAWYRRNNNLHNQFPYKALLVKSDFTDRSYREVDFKFAMLIDSKLIRADLRWSDLSYGDFTRSDLTDAKLSNTKADNSDFTEAILINADFTEAILINADFTRSILINADFTRSILSGAIFTDAQVTKEQAKYLESQGFSGFVIKD